MRFEKSHAHSELQVDRKVIPLQRLSVNCEMASKIVPGAHPKGGAALSHGVAAEDSPRRQPWEWVQYRREQLSNIRRPAVRSGLPASYAGACKIPITFFICGLTIIDRTTRSL